ncbi:chymotrypsinogen B-like [Physella acuta]|uniref:chymotrypsinogen B-like n=1 Tax=Physella acuta TaxID=109671 RepID=UPI0027DC51FA|nr:chymotrypsinogen B-like [Physella acuta]
MRLKLWTSPGLLVLVLLLLASRAAGSPYQVRSIVFRRYRQKSSSAESEKLLDGPVTCGTRPLFDGTKISHPDSLSRSTKIVGGHDAERGSNPWQVLLSLRRVNSSPICGGTILNEYWILTAAHCYRGVISSYIVAGDHNQLIDEKNDQKFDVENVIKHEKYQKATNKNDIALVKIKPKNGRGIQFNNYVQPACLPDADTELKPDQKFTISGWGRRNRNEVETPSVLQETQVELSSNTKICCHNTYDPSTMLCSPAEEQNTSKGDSGGPLVAYINGVYQLFGVTSFGNSSCSNHPHSYLTKVQAYLDWIDSTIRNNSKNDEEKFLPPRPYD